mmetsp:Transcript_47456/g.100844  ORF Transcript_47456/g.100844 Transcript_47456/m.100844 type:complete len:271 (-) Transcript_47456:616-1428(-)
MFAHRSCPFEGEYECKSQCSAEFAIIISQKASDQQKRRHRHRHRERVVHERLAEKSPQGRSHDHAPQPDLQPPLPRRHEHGDGIPPWRHPRRPEPVVLIPSSSSSPADQAVAIGKLVIVNVQKGGVHDISACRIIPFRSRLVVQPVVRSLPLLRRGLRRGEHVVDGRPLRPRRVDFHRGSRRLRIQRRRRGRRRARNVGALYIGVRSLFVFSAPIPRLRLRLVFFEREPLLAFSVVRVGVGRLVVSGRTPSPPLVVIIPPIIPELSVPII